MVSLLWNLRQRYMLRSGLAYDRIQHQGDMKNMLLTALFGISTFLRWLNRLLLLRHSSH